MIDQSEFFEKYRITREDFEATKLEWSGLKQIYDDYTSRCSTLEPTANEIATRLQQIEAVHSLKIRLKDPEHLIEKIIRKRRKDSSLDINIQNYREIITDLIGIRALHLFKDDWTLIHDFITKTWEPHEKPTANIRKGDEDFIVSKFKERGCAINEHKFGYRSVHYLVKSQPIKETHITEIQVRTIFEEGWSEIDHQFRYSHDLGNAVLADYLGLFNRLAGAADEMGSFVKSLKNTLDKHAKEIEERNRIIEGLENKIKQLKIGEKQKKELEDSLNILRAMPSSIAPQYDILLTSAINTIATEICERCAANFFVGIEGGRCKKCNRNVCNNCIASKMTIIARAIGDIICKDCGCQDTL